MKLSPLDRIRFAWFVAGWLLSVAPFVISAFAFAGWAWLFDKPAYRKMIALEDNRYG